MSGASGECGGASAPGDWPPFDAFSREHVARLNPRMPAADRARLESALAAALAADRARGADLERGAGPLFAEPHLFLATSGTTAADPGALKWVALSFRAFRAGARAANACLQSDARDTWFLQLPEFHVGGLAIRARAQLSGARVVRGPSDWDAAAFVAAAGSAGATLASLVPTQLHDLVRGGLRAPARLRAVLLGGGALAPELWRAARELGWPVLPTYGMTECGSQAATAALSDLDSAEFPPLRLMPHLEAARGDESRLRLRGASLFTAYVTADGSVVDPKREGWHTTDDRGAVEAAPGCAPCLRIEGRTRDLIKVGAENVDLARLDRVLEGLLAAARSACADACGDIALFAAPDERLGHVIHAAAVDESKTTPVVDAFNAGVFPYERIRKIHWVAEIPRTELGKLHRARLEALVINWPPRVCTGSAG